MRLSKLLSSRYLIPTTPKFSFPKRRRSQETQEQDSWELDQESYQEQQVQEQSLTEEPVHTEEEECGATLYNLEMVALGGQSTMVFQEEREATTEEVGETHEIRKEFPTQRQDMEDIRKYGLSAECREKPAEEERDQETQERDDPEEMQLRKVANKNTKLINEDDDYGPSFIDALCFSSKPVVDTTEEYKEDDGISEAIQDEAHQKPFDRLVGGHLYKNHKDDKIGLCVKNSTTKDGVYISSLQIGSRFKWSTDVSLDGMRILSINGRPCPSDLEETVDMMKQAEGDLKLVAAAIEAPKPIPPLEEEEDLEEEEEEESLPESEMEEDQTKSTEADESTLFSDDKISALTDEKEHGKQSNSGDSTTQVHDSKGEQEELSEDLTSSKTSLAFVRETSTVHYL